MPSFLKNQKKVHAVHLRPLREKEKKKKGNNQTKKKKKVAQ